MALQLYDEQMVSIKKAVEHSFVDSMLAHVKQFFPNDYRMFEGNELRAYCEYTIEKAVSFRFETERDIFLFLNVMIQLGVDFDSDPLLVWALDILNDEIAEPEYNIELLADSTSAWVNRISGPNNTHFEQALLCFQKREIESFLTGKGAEITPNLLVLFEDIYPQKYAVLAHNELHKFIQQGIKSAQSCGLESELSVSVYLSCMFLFGAGIANDNRFAWLTVMAQSSVCDANQIGQMVFDKGVKRFNAYLQPTIS